jgi:hypothetical protein
MNKEHHSCEQDTTKNQIHPDLFDFSSFFADFTTETESQFLYFRRKMVKNFGVRQTLTKKICDIFLVCGL